MRAAVGRGLRFPDYPDGQHDGQGGGEGDGQDQPAPPAAAGAIDPAPHFETCRAGGQPAAGALVTGEHLGLGHGGGLGGGQGNGQVAAVGRKADQVGEPPGRVTLAATDALQPAQFLGKNFREVLPPELAEQVAARFTRLFATNEVQQFEYTLPVDGTERAYEARLVPLGSDQVLSVIREVSDRKDAEAALRARFGAWPG